MTHDDAVHTLASERYLLDDMSADDRLAFEAHFFACEACAEDLRCAAAMLEEARLGAAGASASARVLPIAAPASVRRARALYRSVALPWAAAAVLAGVAVYQSAWVVPGLRSDGATVALVPVTLRPASRGAEAVVTLGRGTRLIGLALDVNEPPTGPEVAYEISGSDGRRVASGRAAAPAPGSPLLLVVPAWTLDASMHYILAVRDIAPSARVLGEYRFTLATR